jgi:hypothetical protein
MFLFVDIAHKAIAGCLKMIVAQLPNSGVELARMNLPMKLVKRIMSLRNVPVQI